MKKLTMQSKLKDVYATAIGHDIINKLLMQMGKTESIITNPIVGNLSLKIVARLTKKTLGENFFHTFITLLNSEQDEPGSSDIPVSHKWWKEAVFYQIYPRTFMDSNKDGVGDIRGMIEKLDYLKSLGVDAIWLSPIYDSPNDDNGYDIRDYRKIQDEFGTMEDFDELLQEVHKRDMHLIMDLVINHTSDEHEWFKEALKDKDSPYREYYFFREGKEKEPNNWKSFFSGSAWNYYKEQDIWALHLFSKKQMDLNHDNENVRKDIIEMINWWLNKGVDGFRMDVINYISKAPGLPDGDEMVGKLMEFTGVENYFYGPNLHKYLHEIREKAFELHQAFSVGETPGLGMKMCQLVTGEDRKELDMVFSFDHLETPGHVRFDDYKYDLNYLKNYFTDWQMHYGNQCWMSLFFNNHDNPKMISKINPKEEYAIILAKLLAVIQFTLKGTPFVYQGDELGLTNYPFTSIEQITDVESKGAYQEYIKTMSKEEAFKKILAGTREHARLMVPWEEIDTRKEIWNFYQNMIKMRKEHETFVYGEFILISDKKNHWTYQRKDEYGRYIIDCNLSDKSIKREFRGDGLKCIMNTYGKIENSQMLRPYEAVIYEAIK